jgi:hypothetical protein
MGFPLHTLEVINGVTAFAGGATPDGAAAALPLNSDRVLFASLASVDTGASGSTTSTSTTVTLAELPAQYAVAVTPSCVAAVSIAKASGSISVTLSALTGDIPAGATFDVTIFA